MSLRAALHQCFEDEPSRVFAVRDLYEGIEKYYELTFFQRQPDPQYGGARYKHEVRSELAKMTGRGTIHHIGRDQYRRASN